MALTLDGLAVLQSMAANPGAFPAVIAEAAKIARSLVMKQLKAKTSDLNSLRGVRHVLGDEFVLLVEGMTDAEVKSLVSKVDKHYPQLKSASADQLRNQLNSLAKGTADPSDKGEPTKPAKPKAPPKEAPLDRLSSTAMAAVRKRRRS
jgi:hypothetical protein